MRNIGLAVWLSAQYAKWSADPWVSEDTREAFAAKPIIQILWRDALLTLC